MTTFIANLVFPASAAPSRPRKGFALRLLDRLVALDAGYRNAHALANTTDARLADMGISRKDAEAEFARYTGQCDIPAPSTAAW
jgi:uncharacterized protein YjiS (DUF1127 family)